MTQQSIKKLIEKYTSLDLQCDGMTRVISYILKENGIKHVVCIGKISNKKRSIQHWWIELSNGKFIDYRVRMWLGNSSKVPNGIFSQNDYPEIEYDCRKQVVLNVSPLIFGILTGSF